MIFAIMRSPYTNKKDDAMYDTTIATKLIGQLEKFLGRISPRFHKPVARFIGDMMYGIMAEKDVKLSSVVRALKEGITPKKVEDRLSRMLSSKGLERGLHDAIAADGAGKVHQDTLVILDPSDVQKPHAKKMEHLAKVWDGSKGDVGDNLGYWGCMAVACESGGRRPVPLHFRLWSADSPGFVSENDEVEGIVKAISKHTKKRGIYVYDRGGDNIEFYRFLLSMGLDFIVRLKDRYVRSWKRTVTCGELAWECRMQYREVVSFDRSGATPGHPGQAAAHGRRQGLRQEADDAADDAREKHVARGALAGGRGVHHAMEGRGHHPPRQAVLQTGGHTPVQVRQAQGHGCDRPCDHILQHGVDRQLGEARGDRKERREDVVPHTRRAGLPLLRHR